MNMLRKYKVTFRHFESSSVKLVILLFVLKPVLCYEHKPKYGRFKMLITLFY